MLGNIDSVQIGSIECISDDRVVESALFVIERAELSFCEPAWTLQSEVSAMCLAVGVEDYLTSGPKIVSNTAVLHFSSCERRAGESRVASAGFLANKVQPELSKRVNLLSRCPEYLYDQAPRSMR